MTVSDAPSLDELCQTLRSGSSLKRRFAALEELAAAGDAGLAALIDYARERSPQPYTAADWILGRIDQWLQRSDSDSVHEFWQTHYPHGVIALSPPGSDATASQVDYQTIQDALRREQYEEADRLTLQKMCELAGPEAVKRKWLYFTEVDRFSPTDLKIIDTLWLTYSQGQFGFSVQRELWLGVGRVWDQLWPKIQWKNGTRWTRYPNEFTWSLAAPRGHLPLTNQLRGVRVMNSLMCHPAWDPEG